MLSFRNKKETSKNVADTTFKNRCFVISRCVEKFIKTCLDYYGLDPCHYFSSPGLSWDAMLNMTGIELELISDTDMHLFIEKGMRGWYFIYC